MNERNEAMSDGCSIDLNVIQSSDEKSTATMTNQPSNAIKSANIDPIAVLKRVENLRKWQEEEQKKLLKAHEEYMKKIQTEQVCVYCLFFLSLFFPMVSSNTRSLSNANSISFRSRR
jgi:hypothetical protein